MPMVKRCFVIIPFSKTSEEHTEAYWTEHFRTFLKPHIEEGKRVTAHRSEPLRGDILRQIIKEVVISPIVVADLTDGNPNVYCELGVRQSFKHGTVTIAEKGTKLPFDVSVKGTLFYYPKDHIKNAMFVKQFKKAINDCLSRPDSPDSHVLETISGRGTLFEIIRRDEAVRRVRALISECKENINILSEVFKRIKKNQKKPKQRAYVTRRLRSPAIELLITTRYLDEKDSFYELAEDCFDGILGRNQQLASWTQHPEATEEWFLKVKTKAPLGKILKAYNKILDGTQKKLTASF